MTGLGLGLDGLRPGFPFFLPLFVLPVSGSDFTVLSDPGFSDRFDFSRFESLSPRSVFVGLFLSLAGRGLTGDDGSRAVGNAFLPSFAFFFAFSAAFRRAFFIFSSKALSFSS